MIMITYFSNQKKERRDRERDENRRAPPPPPPLPSCGIDSFRGKKKQRKKEIAATRAGKEVRRSLR